MKSYLIPALMLMASLLWAGMIIGIFFIEAPVKFTAPHVTLTIGLSIGRLVFGIMNKVEIAFCAVLLSGLFFYKMPRSLWFITGVPVLILGLQTAWLLPALDMRALEFIAGNNPGPSNLHFIYVAFEFLKFGSLLVAGYQIFKAIIEKTSNPRKTTNLKSFSANTVQFENVKLHF